MARNNQGPGDTTIASPPPLPPVEKTAATPTPGPVPTEGGFVGGAPQTPPVTEDLIATRERASAQAEERRQPVETLVTDSRAIFDEHRGDHLIVRSKRDRFRRAGMAFTRKWTAIRIGEITPDQLNALLDENELESQRVSEGTARDLIETQDMAGTDSQGYASVSKAHLIAEVSRLKEDNAGLRARVAQLEAGDRAPKQGETIATDGSRSPLPLPETSRRR